MRRFFRKTEGLPAGRDRVLFRGGGRVVRAHRDTVLT